MHNICLVPRRLSFDKNVRANEGGKETTGETYPRRVCEEEAVSPHTLDSSIIMFTTELHNVYYRTLNRKTTSRGRDGTAFNLMKLPHAKVTAGQES